MSSIRLDDLTSSFRGDPAAVARSRSRGPSSSSSSSSSRGGGIDVADLVDDDGHQPSNSYNGDNGDNGKLIDSDATSSSSSSSSSTSRITQKLASAIPGPPWVRNIIVTEACERYSYYGLRAVLTLYLTQALLYSKDTSVAIASYTSALAYFTPLLGGYVSDTYLGKYRTIIGFALLYCVGSLVLATTAIGSGSIAGCFIGLILIGFGTGGIKPCVSSFGADQFAGPYAQGKAASRVEEEVTQYFHAFYFAINSGSVCSYIFTPLFRRYFGFSVAFGVPALFLFIATAIVWSARARYYNQPPRGSVLVPILRVLRYALFSAPTTSASTPLLASHSSSSSSPSSSSPSPSSPSSWLDKAAGAPGVTEEDIYNAKCLARVLPFFSIMPAFWMLFDQQSNAWVLQADQMERYGLEPEQLNLANPVFVMLLIPLFESVVYPWCERRSIRFGVFRRVGLGMLLSIVAFLLSAAVQSQIDNDLSRLTKEATAAEAAAAEAAAAAAGIAGELFSSGQIITSVAGLDTFVAAAANAANGTAPIDIEQSTVSVFLQLPQFLALSCGEVLISITCLEFAYTQAPASMKSLLSAVWLVTTAVGDLLCGVLYNALATSLDSAKLYVLFAALMLVNFFVFLLVVYRFNSKPVPVPDSVLRMREEQSQQREQQREREQQHEHRLASSSSSFDRL